METKRLKGCCAVAQPTSEPESHQQQMKSMTSSKMWSYCIIRSKLKRAKDEDTCSQQVVSSTNSNSKLPPNQSSSFEQDQQKPSTRSINSPTIKDDDENSSASSNNIRSQTIAISLNTKHNLRAKLSSSSSGYHTQATSGGSQQIFQSNTNNCQQELSPAQNDDNELSSKKNEMKPLINQPSATRRLIKPDQEGSCLGMVSSNRKSKTSFNWALLMTITFVCLIALIDWRLPEPSKLVNTDHESNRIILNLSQQQQQHVYQQTKSSTSFTETLVDFLSKLFLYPTREFVLNRRRRSSVLLVEAQYRPEWPSKSVEQEIFLLNLEDGYFGCQVNESQDFLQLFELSRLCDGQAHCFQGTDELALPLKCNNRQRCGTYTNSRGQQESFQCVNGVCLDGLCYCNDGFGGKSCDVPDDNECKFRPCDVFAHCTNTMGSYYCSCFPGYDGDGMHCQDINECEIPSLAALCSDNSECCNLPGHFVCKCKPGYQQSGQSQSLLSGAPSGNTSVLCTDIDECLDERACGKGATCENLPGSFRCSCPPGFTGDPAIECIDMDECRNNPCGIGAQCTNIPGGYRCSCAPGFERSPSLPANMFGTIQSTASIAEFTNSSIVACLDINECSRPTPPNGKSICGSGAQCINTPGAYFCQCPPGYTGNPTIACADIDECAAHACGPNTECKNTPGSHHCECKQGYSGDAYSAEGCQDEDECLKKDACGLNAQCFNTLGSHECSCLSGYSGNPNTKCSDIDECSNGNPCGPGAQCHNLAGGYKCACPDKYLARGSPEMGCERAAVDIGCSGDYDCTRNALCVNSTCQCKLGFQINGIECVDIDECTLSQPQQLAPPAPIKAFTKLSSAIALHQQQNSNNNMSEALILCGTEAQCVNTEGSYRCECRAGYEKVDPLSPKSKCRDINECEQLTGQTPCGQNSKCFNTDGSFKCACSDGFIPIDQDPANGCKSPCDGVNCGQHATCKPHGEEAACVCKPGFTFDPNNIKLGCVDINECDTNYGPSGLCGQRAICTNVPGSYRCHCPTGYSGDAERYCEDINECDRKFGVFGQCGELAVCNNTAGSYTCSCASGYTGDPRTKCFDIDECSTKFGPNGKCGYGAVCSNLPGKFSCRCPTDYSGDPYERCQPEQPTCASAADCSANQICKSGRCHCPFAQSTSDNQQQTSGGDQTANNQQQAALQECRHPCDKIECGSHATCQLDNENQALCVCDAGYMAPGDGRSGCVDVNECIQGVTLSGITPLSALTSGRGGVALGPTNVVTTVAPPGASTAAAAGSGAANSSHPCGRNALCRNHPGSFDCVCPPGYSGDAYQACTLDVRNQVQQQQQQQQQQNKVSQVPQNQPPNTVGGAFGNYQQEPRTTACSEPCSRGHVCSDGQCVKPDSCRDNHDCRTTMACEHVNQLLGFQCVNACELNHCGPEAKCTPQNHKPICSCNASAGYAGDPYDLNIGCQLQSSVYDARQNQNQQQQQQLTSTTSSNFQHQTLTTKHDYNAADQHRTTQGASQPQGDLSTVSFDYNSQIQQSTTHSLPGTGINQSNGSSLNMEQLNRQQQQYNYDQPSDPLRPTKRPNQPIYELPLPTTPFMPQFSLSLGGQQSPSNNQPQQTNFTSNQIAEQIRQQQQQQQLSNQVPLMPQLTQTTIVNQLKSTTTSQQLNQPTQTTTPNLFTNINSNSNINNNNNINNSKKPQQQPSNVISTNNNNNQQQQQHNTANRQDNNNNLLDTTQQGFEQRQNQQLMREQQHNVKDHQQTFSHQELQIQGNYLNPFANNNNNNNNNNKSSSLITNYVFTHKQVACTSDQHCPGNLFCLNSDSLTTTTTLTKTNQKICGCPAGYKREADYCFMQRVNCTSSALCKAREECISSITLQQYYASSSLIQQQLAISSGSGSGNQQQFSFSNGAEEYSGICVCPRGYKLTASGIACIDRNECDEGTPCAVGAICQNKIGSYECVCPPGSVGEPYTKTCEPIVKDECKSNSECPNDRECDLLTHKCVSPCYVCGPRAICTAANHQAICLCPPRYTGNAIDLVYGCQEPITTTIATTTTTTGSITTTGGLSTGSPTSSSTTTTTTTVAPTTTTLTSQQTTTQQTSRQTSTISSNNQQQPTTTAVGVPITTLLPTTTTVAPFESTTPELVEFRTIPPSELFVMCLADGIQVEVQLGGFDGIIYVKGHSQDPKCRKLVMSSNANEFVDFKVQFGHCDLIHRDGEAGFVLVIQKHPKLVTYRARAYHVKCVYNTGERTVTLGFNVSMITTSGTIANTGPPPTCLMSITALDGREVTSAEIGQDLLLRVDVQPDSIYGGFARSCEAKTMDDEGEYQYEVTDANGCATDASIFSDWKYDQQRKSLVARFNAFKFPSSNNLRFQCNIRVCFGSCPAVNCNGIDAYGKRRRRRREAPPTIGSDRHNSSATSDADLDSPSTEDEELIVTDAFKEGALREEVMVQSNAILTFDRKEASLPQQRPQVEDIEFVCLPRLGIMMSIVLTTLLALLALAIGTSCWCFTKRKRQNRSNGPLPHPIDFPNPLLRSSSVSTLREPIYGP